LRGMIVYRALGGFEAVAATAWLVRQPFGGVEALGGQPRRRVGGPGGSQATASQRLRADTFVAARFVGHAVAHTRHMREACGFPLSGPPCGPRGDPRGVPRPAGALLRRPRFQAQSPKRSPVCGPAAIKRCPSGGFELTTRLRWVPGAAPEQPSLRWRAPGRLEAALRGSALWSRLFEASDGQRHGTSTRGGAAAAPGRRRLDPRGRRADARGHGPSKAAAEK
jgi:hypothetical protein